MLSSVSAELLHVLVTVVIKSICPMNNCATTLKRHTHQMLLSIAKIGTRNCTYQISIKSLLVKLTRLHCQVRVQPQPYPRNPKSRHCDNMSFDTFLCVIQRQLTKHPSCYYHTSRQDSRQQSLHLISHTRYRCRQPSTKTKVVPFKVTKRTEKTDSTTK